jgi:hypothetical protein
MSWCNIFCLNQEALEDCIADHPEAQDHFVRLAAIQTAEKTVTKAATRLQNIRDGSSKTEEEMVAQSAASALGNFGKHDDPFGGVQPPVVTRALARARHGVASSRKNGKKGGHSAEYLLDEERSKSFGDEIIHDLEKQHARVTEVPTPPPSHLLDPTTPPSAQTCEKAAKEDQPLALEEPTPLFCILNVATWNMDS